MATKKCPKCKGEMVKSTYEDKMRTLTPKEIEEGKSPFERYDPPSMRVPTGKVKERKLFGFNLGKYEETATIKQVPYVCKKCGFMETYAERI